MHTLEDEDNEQGAKYMSNNNYSIKYYIQNIFCVVIRFITNILMRV